MNNRLAWGLMAALLGLYLVGFALGWADRAPWHLLAVLVAILFLYFVFNMRGRA
jgi:hypothetical protein